MELHEIRRLLKTKSIFDIPLRVAYYARVSTDMEDQQSSLDNQNAHYRELIESNANWTLAEGYVDEGISGTSVHRRAGFLRMIADAGADKFDLVLTKEISRFARNTLDSIQYTRQLLSHCIGVFFQNDGILTFDADSELRLTIMASIAQDESRKLSERVRFGYRQSIKQGKIVGCSRLFGYRYADKRLYIREDEAQIVRELFALYGTSSYSLRQIGDLFWEKGYRNRSGSRIAPNVLGNMIRNARYKGYYIGGKTVNTDLFSKKKKQIPPEEWIAYRDERGDSTPAIVSENIWNAANDILNRKANAVKKKSGTYNHANLMTGKLICTHCNASYHHIRQGACVRWVCSHKIEHGAASCSAPRLDEGELVQVLLEVFAETFVSAEDFAQRYTAMYRSLASAKGVTKEIAIYRKQIELEEKKIEKLLVHNASGVISDHTFATMTAKCKDSIAQVEGHLLELEDQQHSEQGLEARLSSLHRILAEASRDMRTGTISRSFVEQYISTIYATPMEGGVRLDVRLSTGGRAEKRLTSRLGTTSSLFIPRLSASRCTPWAL